MGPHLDARYPSKGAIVQEGESTTGLDPVAEPLFLAALLNIRAAWVADRDTDRTPLGSSLSQQVVEPRVRLVQEDGRVHQHVDALVGLGQHVHNDFLPLPAFCLKALRMRRAQQTADRNAAGELWQDTRGLVFTTKYGTPIEPGNLTRMFALRARRAGLRVIPLRNTRHTCSSLLVALKVHPRWPSASSGTRRSR
jgi:hypothetical protein